MKLQPFNKIEAEFLALQAVAFVEFLPGMKFAVAQDPYIYERHAKRFADLACGKALHLLAVRSAHGVQIFQNIKLTVPYISAAYAAGD